MPLTQGNARMAPATSGVLSIIMGGAILALP
jgi:hypothetical protein